MRLFIRGLLITLLVLPLLLGVTLWLAINREASVVPPAAVSPADVARAIDLIKRNDPRGKLPGITRAVVLSQRDLELLAAQAGRRYGEVRSRVRLQPGAALVQASVPLPANPFGQWLNLELVMHETQALPDVVRCRVGRLRVPAWLVELAVPRVLAYLHLTSQGELAQRLVSRVGFGSQQMSLAYALPNDLQRGLTDSLLPPVDQARIQAYGDLLVRLHREWSAAGPVSLVQLLPPVFSLAQSRSPDRVSAERENRAALAALAFLVNNLNLTAIVPAAQPWPAGRPLQISLAKRPDTPQHFLVSAALAAEGGGPLSDAIGLYKEIADSHGGSGFSFNDLAADRAGTRLGQLAVRQPQWLQAQLSRPLTEPELLPNIADLPENMPEAEFQQRFGGVGAPPYQRMLADIERRLDTVKLLRNAPTGP